MLQGGDMLCSPVLLVVSSTSCTYELMAGFKALGGGHRLQPFEQFDILICCLLVCSVLDMVLAVSSRSSCNELAHHICSAFIYKLLVYKLQLYTQLHKSVKSAVRADPTHNGCNLNRSKAIIV